MHIGFLTPEYPHAKATSSAGLGTSIRNLAVSLAKRNVRVSVFLYGQKEEIRFEEGGIHFYFIREKKYRFLGWFLYRKHLQKILNKAIVSESIDIIEAPDWTGITAFMKLYCPLIIRLHGTDAYFCNLEGRKQKFKNRIFEGSALKSADELISVSTFTAEKTKEIFNLIGHIEIIHNSINAEEFVPSEKAEVKNRILYFGTIIRKKGVLELAEIFNKVVLKKPDAELYMIGKDVVDIFEKKSTLELFQNNLSPQARQQLKYFPEVSFSEIRGHIAEASVVVLPSFAEALPMTWLEAMAMEKALVTSNIGWAKEVMINGETGFMEDPRDHTAFTEKILYLLINPAVAEKMGKNGRLRVVAHFSTEVIAQQNLAFYERVLGSHLKSDTAS